MSVYRRKSGRYAVLVDLEPKSAGLRRRKSIGTYRTRKDAERAERQAIEARDRGIDLAPQTVTVADLLQRYIAERESLGRAVKTLEDYRYLDEHLIRPALGDALAAKLKPARIAEWRDALLRTEKAKQRPGRSDNLSPKTVRHAMALLRGAMRFGVRMELLARNPCDAVTSPTASRSNAAAFSGEEVQRILAAARGTRWESFVLLALTTGARRGELTGLSWSDVDETNAVLSIRRSLSQTRSGVRLKDTKTHATRTLPLSRAALDALRIQHVQQAKDKLAAGDAYANPDGAVFTNERGQRHAPNHATCAFAKLAGAARVATTRLHDCRHTVATSLLTSGTDVRTTAGVLGHHSPTMTLSTYAHLMPEAQREAIERLGERLERLAGTRT